MERLTEWSGKHGALTHGDGYTRLAEYEDTGMSPEDIKQMIEYWNALGDDIQEILKAKAEDRIIILPIKDGTTIYYDGKYFASHCSGEVFCCDDWYYTPIMITRDFHGDPDFEFYLDSLGNAYFLSEEECKKNIEEKRKNREIVDF